SQAVAGAATEDKTVAILAYVTIIGFIVAIVMYQGNKTRLGAFHLRQTLGLVVTGLVGGVVAVVPILGWIVWFVVTLGLLVLWFLGLVSAIRGDERPVPILGEHYQRWFAGAFG
ncbi:MAG TPA: hypothetical protein VEB59_00885, partial [Gemmatimonadales bacterium]|nr:hypothetical protein [Gemmatimonadales bacterium]